MSLPRVRFTVRRLMVVVVAVAMLLWAGQVVVGSLPHVRQCLGMAREEERLSRLYRSAASRFRTCGQTVPCTAADYCDDGCLTHTRTPDAEHPAGPAADRARAAAEHRRAADDHERAAELHQAMARRYYQAALRFSEPLPTWTKADQAAAGMFDRYRCDMY